MTGAGGGEVDLVLLVDRTGSMADTWKEAVGGINFVINDQRTQSGQARLTLAAFDAFGNEPTLQIVHDRVPLGEVPPFPVFGAIQPRGGTPLLDALYALLRHMRERIAALPPDERPCGVAVAVFTDGEENHSQELQGPQGFATLRQLVDECQRDGWQFTFVGAGLEKIAAQAELMGLGKDSVHSVPDDIDGTMRGFTEITGGFHRYRRRRGGGSDDSSGGGQVH